MLRQVPPLAALEAFLAATQAHSFRAAADSLALSPSAFSRRIQQLEEFVGTALFDRNAPGTPLTAAGDTYAAEIAPALSAIQQATMAMRAPNDARRVRVATSHSFAAEWLIPRLPGLADVHGIDVALTISRDPALLRSGAVEIAIRGEALEPAEECEILTPVDVVAVSARGLANGRAAPRSAEALGAMRLLGVSGQSFLWDAFLRHAGVARSAPDVAEYATNQLSYEAAVSGLGVTLAAPLVSDRFLSDGRLVACLPLRAPTGWGYVLRCGARRTPASRDFVAWLKLEVERSMASFDRWHAAIVGDQMPNAEIAVSIAQ